MTIDPSCDLLGVVSESPSNESPRESAAPAGPGAIEERAAADLHYIRRAMERTGAFTAISGWGEIVVGATAVWAARLAAQADTPRGWLLVWIIEAAIALAVATVASSRKAKRAGVPFLGPSGVRFAQGFLPPALVAVLWTVQAAFRGDVNSLPAVWLSLYGAAMLAGGSASVVSVRIMGGLFLMFGAIALFAPPAFGNVALALAFGGLHVAFGLWTARRQGG